MCHRLVTKPDVKINLLVRPDTVNATELLIERVKMEVFSSSAV